MRITVGFVLKLLASNLSVQEVLEAYPELEDEDIRQALNYAAWTVSDKIVGIPSALITFALLLMYIFPL
jgi:uncharacterized protein (DUF433 family)